MPEFQFDLLGKLAVAATSRTERNTVPEHCVDKFSSVFLLYVAGRVMLVVPRVLLERGLWT